VDAGRILREARLRAGITQRELARRAGVLQPAVARIESGPAGPRIDTMEHLLRACDMSLSVLPRWAAGVPREPIRALLDRDPLGRLMVTRVPGFRPIRALRVLSARHVRFVMGGPAGARALGAPVRLDRLDIFPSPDASNRRRLMEALATFKGWRFGVGRVVVRWSLGPVGPWDRLGRAAIRIPLVRYVVRVASIDDLIALAESHAQRALLAAVREELEGLA
jgi:transcriptional regulator with XRE-family HTH domain